MNKRILITYATRGGTTASVAIAIGQILAREGFSVDVLPVGVIKNVEIYSAIIAGSSVRNGNWLPEAIDFLGAHRDALKTRPTALYTVCMTAAEPTPESQAELESYTQPLLDVIQPFSIGYFAGQLDLNERNIIERARVTIKGLPRGDHRDWGAVRDWTLGLTTTLDPLHTEIA